MYSWGCDACWYGTRLWRLAASMGAASLGTASPYAASLGFLGCEVDGAEEAGGDGLDFVEVLHLEAVAVFFYEGFVVVGRERGPGVEGGVVDVDFYVVLSGLEKF